jgi:hypothetical protein
VQSGVAAVDSGDEEGGEDGSRNLGSGPVADADEDLGTRCMTIGPSAITTKASATATSKKSQDSRHRRGKVSMGHVFATATFVTALVRATQLSYRRCETSTALLSRHFRK